MIMTGDGSHPRAVGESASTEAGTSMIETHSPASSSGSTDEPKSEEVRQSPQGQGKGIPQPLQRPKPGRVPLFRR